MPTGTAALLDELGILRAHVLGGFLVDNLREQGLELERIPCVIQYNKPQQVAAQRLRIIHTAQPW